MIYTW